MPGSTKETNKKYEATAKILAVRENKLLNIMPQEILNFHPFDVLT